MGSIVAIVQARMGSTRLPNKMMLYFNGYPIVEWVYKRLLKSTTVDKIIFAVPDSERDDVLCFHLASIGAEIFRGSELDLVDRFNKAAKYSSAEKIVRVCADNVLISPDAIDQLVTYFQENDCDYAYNHIPLNNNWPDGLGAEICRLDILKYIDLKAKKPDHREHLFNYLWDNQEAFKIATFQPPKELAFPKLKLDLDTIEDYEKLLKNRLRINMSSTEIVETLNYFEDKLRIK